MLLSIENIPVWLRRKSEEDTKDWSKKYLFRDIQA